MPSSDASLSPTAGARPSGLRWGVLLASAVAGAAWWAAGVLDDGEVTDPADADHLWQAPAVLVAHDRAVAAASVLLAAVAAGMLVALRRQGRLPGWKAAQTGVLVLVGGWIGAGYRIMTAPVTGANIGGGLVLLVTPAVIVAAVISIAALQIRGRRRG